MTSAWPEIFLAGLFGLFIGSFLNVVIHRLPKMMERDWKAQALEALGQEAPAEPTYNLALPGSACPHCGHKIAWHENLPVVSYLALRGKCSACRAPIGLRYPIVEAVVCALWAWCAWKHGITWTAGAWAFFASVLVAATMIDADTMLLPDSLTLPLLWAGLIASSLGWTGVPLQEAVWGAVAGYLSLWSIYWAFKLLTRKEGMGHGDFKLLAALGVWFGWQALVPIAIASAGIGAVIGIALKATGKLDGPMPFGPFLALAGLVLMLVGVGPFAALMG